jgi:hypothetical protein
MRGDHTLGAGARGQQPLVQTIETAILSRLNGQTCTFDLGVGTFQETVLLAGLGFNASGYKQRFDITLGIHAQIRDRDAISVNEPPALLVLLAGWIGLLGARWRQASRA